MADNTTINSMAGGDVIASDDIGGVKYQRIKLVYGADGTNDGDVAMSNPLPVLVTDTARTFIQLWANGAAAGATGVETAITLAKSAAPGAATTSAASHVVTSGKRFRITSITFATRGNNTATAQVTTFNLRVNTAGAVTTSSNIAFSARSATPATANAWDRTTVFTFVDAGIEIVGDGTLQSGVTAAATFTTNAPTWDVQLTGYEY